MQLVSRTEESLLVPATRFLVPLFVAVIVGVADPAGAQLVNPAFDSGPAGPVLNFGTVVGPPFQDGFWGSEVSSIVNVTTCGTPPRSNPFMLSMAVGGGTHSQAWQVIDVTGNPPGLASVTAWVTTCAIAGSPTMGLEIRTYNSVNGWPTHTGLFQSLINLDLDADTWEEVSVDCALIPADTEWIMVHLIAVNSTMSNTPVYVDDVELVLGGCPTPAASSTWGNIKALYGTESR